jgi:hypothetical protein
VKFLLHAVRKYIATTLPWTLLGIGKWLNSLIDLESGELVQAFFHPDHWIRYAYIVSDTAFPLTLITKTYLQDGRAA